MKQEKISKLKLKYACKKGCDYLIGNKCTFSGVCPDDFSQFKK